MTVPQPPTSDRRAAIARALAWLSHPVSVVAIAVLLVNDHALKAAYGTWWTGKLSDVAGLVFFPALAALAIAFVAPTLGRRRANGLALGVTAVGFAWVKATTMGAAAASAVLSGLGGPSVVLRDRTDLMALPALGLAWWASRRLVGRAWTLRLRAAVVLPVAILATVATSKSDNFAIDDVAVIDGTVYAHEFDISPHGYDGDYWLVMSPDDWADPYPTAAQTDAINSYLEERADAPARVCVDEGVTCFRPAPHRYGVDVSRDGGATWKPDFRVTDTQWTLLAREIPDAEPKEENLVTSAVAVAEVSGETVVLAANGADGMAIRHEDGTWERVGWWGKDYLDDVVPMPPDNAKADLGQVPFPVAAGIVGSVLAYVVAGAARRKRRGILKSVVLYVVGGGLLLISANVGENYAGLAARPLSVANDAEPFPQLSLTVAAAVCMGAAIGGVAVLGWKHGVGFFRSVGWALLAGACGAAAGALAGQVLLLDVGAKYAIALAVAGGLAAWFAWGLKRPRSRRDTVATQPVIEERVDESVVAPDA